MSCAVEKFKHVKYFEHTTFLWLPLDLDINVKDCLSFCSVAFGDRGVREERAATLLWSVCLLFYLCNMCFGLGPDQERAAIIRL